MLLLECYKLLKSSIRFEHSSELVFGYEVALSREENKFCAINVKSRRIRTLSGLRSKDIYNYFAGKVDCEKSMEMIGKSSYEYHIYEFRAHKWRTVQTPEFSLYPPESSAQLVVTKRAMIWWDLTGFKVFDIITEKLCSKGSPPPVGEPKMVAKGDEDLCCCYVRYAETVVDVWVLVDYKNWLWERKYAVNFDWEKNRCPSQAWSAHIPQVTRNTKVVSIQGNILVLDIKGAGAQLHCYDLVSNASWMVDTNKFNGETQTTWYGRRRRVDKHFTWYRLLGL
ncbi:Unknown protein [Striga hermonthica]|uniref:F-box associated domain-containing protein n=1 Tax=Striga hermonthica TaxID=68872 RepID=A0A9N7N4P7_STRHE|nr:Unknown protein [Striga hermonthica]